MLRWCYCFLVETLASNDLSINSINFPDSALPGFSEVAHYTEPSMELFYKKIFMPKVPALLKGNFVVAVLNDMLF